MNKSIQDAGIPVLTEIIHASPRAIPAAAEPASAPVAETLPAAALAPPPIAGWLDEEWTRVEQKVSERVLAQLLERVDTILEQRIEESLHRGLQAAAAEIRQGLQQTLREAIGDAVAHEIDHLQFGKK